MKRNYLLIGSTKLSRRRRDIQIRANQAILDRMRVIQRDPSLAHLHTPMLGPRLAGLVRMSQALGGMPAFGGNTVEGGDAEFLAMEVIEFDGIG